VEPEPSHYLIAIVAVADEGLLVVGSVNLRMLEHCRFRINRPETSIDSVVRSTQRSQDA
jgi:hypothetical protein